MTPIYPLSAEVQQECSKEQVNTLKYDEHTDGQTDKQMA